MRMTADYKANPYAAPGGMKEYMPGYKIGGK